MSERDTLVLVSDPLSQVTDLVGTPTLHLDFTPNKFDVDLAITLFEQLANGDYVQLYGPPYEFRASYAHDLTHRHLLQAGVRAATGCDRCSRCSDGVSRPAAAS